MKNYRAIGGASLKKVISGGQTGVDRAALDAAMKLGLDSGGWCPRGRRARDGVIPAKYSLTEVFRLAQNDGAVYEPAAG